MKCESAREYIMKHFDNELNDIEVGKLKQHLKVCKSCCNEFEEIKEILGAIQIEGTIDPPDGFEADVMSKVKALDQERKKKIDRLLIFMYGITSVVLLGIATLFVGYLQEISFFKVLSKLTVILSSAVQVLQALSVPQVATVVYGIVIVAFAILLGYTGIIVFMDTNVGGAGNETKK